MVGVWKFSGIAQFSVLLCGVLNYCVSSSQVNDVVNLQKLVRSLRENLRPRPCHIDWAIARAIQQGWGLRFSHKDGTFEVDKLFIIIYCVFFCVFKPVIGPWTLQENNALRLANQSMHYIYIGYKNKPDNKWV